MHCLLSAYSTSRARLRPAPSKALLTPFSKATAFYSSLAAPTTSGLPFSSSQKPGCWGPAEALFAARCEHPGLRDPPDPRYFGRTDQQPLYRPPQLLQLYLDLRCRRVARRRRDPGVAVFRWWRIRRGSGQSLRRLHCRVVPSLFQRDPSALPDTARRSTACG